MSKRYIAIAALLLMTMLVASRVEARYESPDGVNQEQPTSWTSRWNMVKESVVAKIQSVFKAVKMPDMFVAQKSETKPSNTVAGRAPASVLVKDVNLKQVGEEIKSVSDVKIAADGVVSRDSRLKANKEGVPVYDFKKNVSVKSKIIPVLDVGAEKQLDSTPFKIIEIGEFPLIKFESSPELEGPTIMAASQFNDALGAPLDKNTEQEKIEIPILDASKKITYEKINSLVYVTEQEMPVSVLPVYEFTADELKLVRGMIIFEKKDQCHVASGLFADVVESENSEVAIKGRYYLGVCLQDINLPTEALYHLSRVIKKGDSRFIVGSVRALLDEMQGHHEQEIAETLLSIDEKMFPEDLLPMVSYVKAKYFIKKEKAEKALEYAEKVPSKHPKYYQAQYIASVAEYLLGRLDASINRQKIVSAELIRKGTNKEILTLVQLNLGRTMFQKGKFKDSLEAYKQVPKSHPLWIPALTEQGWSQLQYKDTAGAIGNMHSIQSPYFESVFKPESYIVRSIGYLDFCQYADSFKSLGYLEHKYMPWLEMMNRYLKSHNANQTYDTVVRYLSTKGQKEVDGLAMQIILEMARQKNYINAQKSMNQILEENTQYGFLKNLIEKDRVSLVARRNGAITKIVQLQQKIKKVSKIPNGAKDINVWKFELANYEDFLNVFDFKMATYKEGMDGLQRLAPKAQQRLAAEKSEIKDKAGKVLHSYLAKMEKNLKLNLENNELLKYEIYAGSGENLRFQVAGGKVPMPGKKINDRRPASLNWDYDGEFWEDEIGNYRSSLKNNCQAQNGAQAK